MYDFKLGDIVVSTYFAWDNSEELENRVSGRIIAFYYEGTILAIQSDGNEVLEDPIEYWIPYAEHIRNIRKRKIQKLDYL
jgi:hypothetical protein